jgi:hypothetical protein
MGHRVRRRADAPRVSARFAQATTPSAGEEREDLIARRDRLSAVQRFTPSIRCACGPQQDPVGLEATERLRRRYRRCFPAYSN